MEGLRKALHIKKDMNPLEDGDLEDEDLDCIIQITKFCCVNQFAPAIQVIKECPMDHPEKWGKDYSCLECWKNILINGKLYKKQEMLEEK